MPFVAIFDAMGGVGAEQTRKMRRKGVAVKAEIKAVAVAAHYFGIGHPRQIAQGVDLGGAIAGGALPAGAGAAGGAVPSGAEPTVTVATGLAEVMYSR